MDFLGIGPMELLLILVIALLVFGPQKLPEIGRQLGKTMQSFRKASHDITTQLTSEVEESHRKPEAKAASPPATAATVATAVPQAPYEIEKQITAEAEKSQPKAEGTGTSTTETPR